MNLTKRQREIYDYLRSFLEKHGYAPSLEEIAGAFGLSSVATVHEHLSNLEAKGVLRRDANRSRALELTRPGLANAIELPLLGRVAAGEPLEVIVDEETIAVPEHLLGRGETFVLKVRGDSMIDGERATFKTFRREADGTIRLEPANERMRALRYAPERVQIQGVAIGVLRKYR